MKAYENTLQWMYDRLPMYQRKGAIAYRPGLDAISHWAEYLGNPHRQFKSIHVAGTNGKGSTTHMMASVLQTAGYNTGLYTSPHLLDFRERIKVNGLMIPKEKVVQFIETHRAYIETHQLSFFEMTVGMAFAYFAEKKVDYGVIEVGMGGRLDATNIITPKLSVITNIALDHTQFLGSTRAEIAGEKAGIIKSGIPVVVGEEDLETKNVFLKKAAAVGAPIYFAKPIEEIWPSDLTGQYQKLNSATVVSALHVLKDEKINDSIIKKGLLQVKRQTHLMGRWQKVGESPEIILDVGHNEAGLKALALHLETITYQKLHLVMGFVKERDVALLLSIFSQNANFYLSCPKIDRGLAVVDLKNALKESSLNIHYFNSLEKAFQTAKSRALPKDLILVCGSTFVVAEILESLKIIKAE